MFQVMCTHAKVYYELTLPLFYYKRDMNERRRSTGLNINVVKIAYKMVGLL